MALWLDKTRYPASQGMYILFRVEDGKTWRSLEDGFMDGINEEDHDADICRRIIYRFGGVRSLFVGFGLQHCPPLSSQKKGGEIQSTLYTVVNAMMGA